MLLFAFDWIIKLVRKNARPSPGFVPVASTLSTRPAWLVMNKVIN